MTRVLNSGVAVCPHCGQRATQTVERRRATVTLFFVPVLPLSTKHRVRCAACGAQTDVSASQARELAAAPSSVR